MKDKLPMCDKCTKNKHDSLMKNLISCRACLIRKVRELYEESKIVTEAINQVVPESIIYELIKTQDELRRSK